ncbi:hypothetical protein GUY44_12680 [Pimelobacter simplex]|uniref:Uncharacterized protein n=1 Tax=Nocardioides simplex TaxID=2045 RepID=A0A0C5XG22_NOCSI|nr:hypothetical protein [Pimelobacter simplex]AJR18131.1 hypothetical protein KR76_04760 [Pimelobacter simplex]MCG8151338.1 hypothetical protein [Pimelobacter simplex]GEB12112.1 hypothetical protein NSI01_04270 [Pimelobacter simplex]SFN17805.1 hypothetical protein SAMN05421671_5588 [Pimelobacter simplex]
MTLGLPPEEDDRALLTALIAAAAPDAVPADQAIPLLCRIDETDVVALARLAYHALTGVAPGPGTPEPAAPTDLEPGFPPFASEVLVRAIVGPDHRRPTPQALLVVLELVGAGNWPTSGRPHVVLAEPEPVVEVGPEPVVEVEPAPVAAKPAPEEFRSLLLPTRAVPRFDPLTDPLPEVVATPTPPAPEPVVAVEPIEPESEVLAEPEPAPPAPPEPEPTDPEPTAPEPIEPEPIEPEPIEPTEPTDDTARHVDPTARPAQDEFRQIVAPTYEVPHFAPLEGAGPMPGLGGPERRRRSGRKGRKRHQSTVNHTSAQDRRQTFVLVAVILVLVVLGAIYAASRDDDTPQDGAGDPQGASRVLDQPPAAARP